MAAININLRSDLQHPVKVQYLDGNLFSQDEAANTIIIEVTDGGAPAALGGNVVANVIRADGGTVAVTGGTVEGNIVSVTLPAAAYAVIGAITVIVKLTGEDVTTTIAALVANVYQSSTDTVVDPGTIIPSIEDLIDAIEDAVESIPADYSSLWTSLAPAFSTGTAYVAGQYVTYNGGLYRFTTAHAAGSWNSAHVTAVNLGGEITDLKSALYSENNLIHTFTKEDMESGYWGYSTKIANSKRLRNANLMPVKKGTIIRYSNPTQKVYFGVLETMTSNTYLQTTGWISAGGNSEIRINYDGYMTYMIEGSDPTTVDDYNVTTKLYIPPTQKDFNEFKSAFNLSTWADKNYIDMSQVNITEGQYIKQDGTIASNSLMVYTDYIEISDGVASVTVNRIIHDSTAQYPQNYMVWWYDANKTLLGVGVQQIKVGSLLTSVKSGAWKARYIRVNLSRNHVNPFIWLGHEPELRYNGYYEGNIDIHTITTPGYYAITSAVGATNMPKATMGLLTVKKASWEGYIEHTFVCNDGVYVEFKLNNTTGWTNWFEIIDRTKLTSAIENRFGKVGSFTGAFTQTETITANNIILKKNTSYLIRFNNTRSGLINIYGHENISNFKRVYAWMNEVVFVNDGTDRYLDFYNPLGQLDTIDVDVFTIGSIEEKAEKVPTVYTVTKNASTADYTSLSKCLIDLKDDHNPKIIEIWEGDYDIYAEYQELYTAGLLEKYQGTDPSMDYFNYCVWVPENTHLIGKGIVRLKWEPSKAELEADEMTGYQTCCISPLNVAATATIENIEVYCKNGRYCLHNDGLGISQFTGAVQKYINCRFYKYQNDRDDANNTSYGFNHTTGFGIDRSQHHVYENCVFENYVQARAFYGHSRLATVTGNNQSPDITLVNCVIDAFKIHKCITAITTPAPWDASKWENGIPDSSVTELEIHNMIANAKPWSAASTYDVGDTLYVVSSEYVKFGNSTTNTQNAQIRTMFNSCCVKGTIRSEREGTSGTEFKNAFDMQFLNCGDVSVRILDATNQYPPQAFNTNMTIVE